MKYILTILLVIVGLASYSQSFNYAYYDPCDGNLKTVAVPLGQNQIAVTYFNQVKSPYDGSNANTPAVIPVVPE